MNAQNIGDKVNFTAVSLTTNTSNKRIALQYLEIAPGPGCQLFVFVDLLTIFNLAAVVSICIFIAGANNLVIVFVSQFESKHKHHDMMFTFQENEIKGFKFKKMTQKQVL